jgi:hypothetical protein
MTIGHKGIKSKPRASKTGQHRVDSIDHRTLIVGGNGGPPPDTGTPTPPPENPPDSPAS